MTIVASKPTLAEVAQFIKEAGLWGKVSPTKFYEYYDRQDFLFRGIPMDWKEKVVQWAQREKKPVTVTAADFKALDEQKKMYNNPSPEELRKIVDMI